MILLDVTAAFDTVDHNILICCLEHIAGIKGITLECFKCYLPDRFFFCQHRWLCLLLSTPPLWSSQGIYPATYCILFSLYMLPLGPYFKKTWHFFLLLYRQHPNLLSSEMERYQLLKAIAGLPGGHLSLDGLNFSSMRVKLRSPKPFIKSSAKNLGMFMGTSFKTDKQISSVIKSSFFQLRL